MFKVFIKNNQVVQILFIIMAIVVFGAISVHTNSTTHTLIDGGELYLGLINLIDHSPLIIRILAILLVVSSGYFFNEILKVYQLLPRRNYLVFFFWIILMGAFPDQWLLSPQLVSIFFLLLAIYTLFKVNEQEKEDLPGLLNYALLVGIASLFYKPLVWFIAFLFISLFIIRQMNFRNLLIILSGFLLPWLYLVVVAFIKDSAVEFLTATWSDFTVFRFNAMVNFDIVRVIILAVLALLFVYSFVISLQNVQNKLIQIRSGHSILILLFLVSFLNVFGVSNGNTQWISMLFLPASAIFAFHYNDLKKTLVADVVWVSLIIVFVIFNLI